FTDDRRTGSVKLQDQPFATMFFPWQSSSM
ncbi:MAG: hypothetical protein ACI9B8_001747, partial [Sulfitobacter sp.]